MIKEAVGSGDEARWLPAVDLKNPESGAVLLANDRILWTNRPNLRDNGVFDRDGKRVTDLRPGTDLKNLAFFVKSEQCNYTCISDGTCSRQDDVCQPCGDTGLCPDPGDRCIAFTETEAYCVQRCRDTSDCPAAFSCMPLEGGISVCVGDCGWLRDEGWL